MTKADSEFLYKGKYRVETTRLKSWDYANDGWYFVTICTRNRAHFFSEVVNDVMQLSEMGDIAQKFWCEIPDHYPHVLLDRFVVMPNHVHGIVILNREGRQVENEFESNPIIFAVETRDRASLRVPTFVPPSSAQKPSVDTANKFGPLKPGSLQAVINGYKAAVTRGCKRINHAEFGWQERYWDHIIRAEDSLMHIREYMDNNPLKWALDKENAPGLWM